MDRDREEKLAARRTRLHMRRDLMSERVLPAVLISLAVLTLALIVIASTVLLGITSWR